MFAGVALLEMLRLTVKYRRRVLKEGVVGEKQKIRAVRPRHGVEDQLPRALRHLRDVFGMEVTPSAKGLLNEERKRQYVTYY